MSKLSVTGSDGYEIPLDGFDPHESVYATIPGESNYNNFYIDKNKNRSLYPDPYGAQKQFNYGINSAQSAPPGQPGPSGPPGLDENLIDYQTNNALLGIIEQGINQIVYNLKLKLGQTQNEIDGSTFDIKELLNSIGTYVGTEANSLKATSNEESVPNFDRNSEGIYSVSNNPNYYKSIANIEFKDPDQDPIDNFNLISDFQPLHQDYDASRYNENIETDLSTEEGILEVTKRLKNCQNLEFLYLRKHEEIMKIFAFTINLFDKYKYSIKVILFLLKYLLPNNKGEKDEDEDKNTEKMVKLPEPIIKNIKKMLKDEQKIQGVIDTMKSVIIDGKKPLNPTDPNIDQQKIDQLAKLNSKLPIPVNEITDLDAKIPPRLPPQFKPTP